MYISNPIITPLSERQNTSFGSDVNLSDAQLRPRARRHGQTKRAWRLLARIGRAKKVGTPSAAAELVVASDEQAGPRNHERTPGGGPGTPVHIQVVRRPKAHLPITARSDAGLQAYRRGGRR